MLQGHLIKFSSIYRLRRSFHGSVSETNQRVLRGSDQKIKTTISNSISPSKLGPSLVENSQIQRSHEKTSDVTKPSPQKENISKSSRSSSILTKDFDLLENEILQEELVNAVKNHFQENFQLNKPTKKVPTGPLSKLSKDDSSDDDIEGTSFVYFRS